MTLELVNTDGTVIASDSDLYSILGLATRSTDEVTFDADFYPPLGMITRAVTFKLRGHNWMPILKHTGKTCVEFAAKRISSHID